MSVSGSPLRNLVVRDLGYYARQPFVPDPTASRDRWLQLPESSNADQVADLLAPYLLPGDVVLDPFAGAGSTLVAARRLGHRALGVEPNPIAFAGACAKSMLGAADVDALAALNGTIGDVCGPLGEEPLLHVSESAASDAVAAAAVATYASVRLDLGARAGVSEWVARVRAVVEDVAAEPVAPAGSAIWGDGGDPRAYSSARGAAGLVLCTSPPHVATRHRSDDAFVAVASHAERALRGRGLSPVGGRDGSGDGAGPLDAYAARIRRVLGCVSAAAAPPRLALLEFEATPEFASAGEVMAEVCQECGLTVVEIRVLYDADPSTGEPRTGGIVVAVREGVARP